MGAGHVLCDDVLRRRMHTCVLSVSSTVGQSVGLSIPALRLGTEQKATAGCHVINMKLSSKLISKAKFSQVMDKCSMHAS